MAVHGKNTRVYVNEFDLSSTLKKADPTATIDKHDTTCFGSSSKTYDVGLKDGTLTLSGLFTGNAGETDQVLKDQLGAVAGSILTQAIDLDTIGKAARLMKVKQGSYKTGSPVADLVAVDADFQADGGIQFGVFLHAKGAETAAANFSAVDNAAATAAGWSAHLHVFGFTGTDITIKIQDSADSSNWTDLVTFSTVSGVTSERALSTNATDAVKRYTRCIISGGTFTSATIAVAFARQRP